jgi:hypothetical protein
MVIGEAKTRWRADCRRWNAELGSFEQVSNNYYELKWSKLIN